MTHRSEHCFSSIMQLHIPRGSCGLHLRGRGSCRTRGCAGRPPSQCRPGPGPGAETVGGSFPSGEYHTRPGGGTRATSDLHPAPGGRSKPSEPAGYKYRIVFQVLKCDELTEPVFQIHVLGAGCMDLNIPTSANLKFTLLT